jgi:hypothetical protein
MLLSIKGMRALSLMMLVATAPATRPTTSAGRARPFKTIKKPTMVPVTGQNAETPEGRASIASPSWITKKKATVKKVAQPSVDIQTSARGIARSRDIRASLKVPPRSNAYEFAAYIEAAEDDP